MDILQRFNSDKHLRDALLEYVHNVIDQEGLAKIYSGEDVSHVKEARELIDKAFNDLQEQYTVYEKHEAQNIAR